MKVFKYMLVLVFIAVMLQNCSSDKKSNTDNNFSNETASKSEVSNSAQEEYKKLENDSKKTVSSEKEAEKLFNEYKNEIKAEKVASMFHSLYENIPLELLNKQQKKRYFKALDNLNINNVFLGEGGKKYILHLNKNLVNRDKSISFLMRFVEDPEFIAHSNFEECVKLNARYARFFSLKKTDVGYVLDISGVL